MKESSELKKLRMYNGLTIKDISELLGVDERTYFNKENGLSQFKLNEMFIISREFGMPMDEIFLPTDFMNQEVLVKED